MAILGSGLFVNVLAIDFDGVLTESPGRIGGRRKALGVEWWARPPKPGAIEGMRQLAGDWVLVVHTCRADSPDGIRLVWEWLETHGIQGLVKDVTNRKPIANAYLDDKAFHFVDWPSALEQFEVTWGDIRYGEED